MDLLYSKYASPLELMDIYIEQGRFDEFVSNIVRLENQKRQEDADKASDDRLWIAYVHSMPEMSFSKWKEELLQNGEKEPETLSMTDEQVESAKQQARGILKSFSPN